MAGRRAEARPPARRLRLLGRKHDKTSNKARSGRQDKTRSSSKAPRRAAKELAAAHSAADSLSGRIDDCAIRQRVTFTLAGQLNNNIIQLANMLVFSETFHLTLIIYRLACRGRFSTT